MGRRRDPVYLFDFSLQISSEVLVSKDDVIRLLLFVCLKMLHIGIDLECFAVVCDCGLYRSHFILGIKCRSSSVFVVELVLILSLPVDSSRAFIWPVNRCFDRAELTALSRRTLISLDKFYLL